MTAVRAYSIETKADKAARLEKEWLKEAAGYMFKLNIFDGTDVKEIADAYQLAETLWENSDNMDAPDWGNWMTPKEAVDEELTYWGD